MARVALSGQDLSIEFVWSWYEDQKEALFDFRSKVFSAISLSSILPNEKFIGMTTDELNAYFEESENELEHLVCFDLISATESLLRSDFYARVYNKDKSGLGRTFREIEKGFGNKISLEEHIINSWKEIVVARKSDFSDFLALLRYRHWLAHGRYWIPKLGREHYSPSVTYNIVERVFNIVDDGQ